MLSSLRGFVPSGHFASHPIHGSAHEWAMETPIRPPFNPATASPALRDAMIACGFLDAEPGPISHHVVCVRDANCTRFLCECRAPLGAVIDPGDELFSQCGDTAMTVVGGVA